VLLLEDRACATPATASDPAATTAAAGDPVAGWRVDGMMGVRCHHFSMLFGYKKPPNQ